MKAEIIAVGTEILTGQIVNTNAQFLSEKLAEIGVDVYFRRPLETMKLDSYPCWRLLRNGVIWLS